MRLISLKCAGGPEHAGLCVTTGFYSGEVQEHKNTRLRGEEEEKKSSAPVFLNPVMKQQLMKSGRFGA